jgi:ubiquitin C-terminal hydrolase
MNSCLQCLSFTKEVVENLTTKDIALEIVSRKDKNEGSITLALSDLFKQLWKKADYKYVSPYKFKKYFGMKNTMFKDKTQEDAHEFLLHLLNSIHEDIKKGNSKVLRSTSKL